MLPKQLLLILVVFFVTFLSSPKQVRAEKMCADVGIGVLNGTNVTLPANAEELSFNVNLSTVDDGEYYIRVFDNGAVASFFEHALTWGAISWLEETQRVQKTTGNTLFSFTINGKGIKSTDVTGKVDTRHVYLLRNDEGNTHCKIGTFGVENKFAIFDTNLSCSTIEISQTRSVVNTDGTSQQQKCYSNGCLDNKSPIFFEKGAFKKIGDSPFTGFLTLKFGEVGVGGTSRDRHWIKPDVEGNINESWPFPDPATYTLTPQSHLWGINFKGACQTSFVVRENCSEINCSQTPKTPLNASVFSLCAQLPEGSNAQSECLTCAGGDDDSEGQAGVWTAIGCIKRDPTSIMQRFISLGLGIGGGVSLIMTLAGGFILTTSQGDPKRTTQAKEMITSAIIGIIFVIFSVTILQFIGYTVFKIPGFGE